MLRTLMAFVAAIFVSGALIARQAAGSIDVPVSNSSFEFVPPTNGSCCGWSDFPDPATYPSDSTWVASNGYGVGGYATNGVGDHFTYTPDSSSHFLYLFNVGSISQDLHTSILPGDKITLSFYDGNDRDYQNHIGGGVMAATISIGGQTITQNFDTTNATPGVWNAESLSGTATVSGDLSISFATVGGTPWLDAVSVTLVTPEPTSLFVWSVVIAGGLLVARRPKA